MKTSKQILEMQKKTDGYWKQVKAINAQIAELKQVRETFKGLIRKTREQMRKTSEPANISYSAELREIFKKPAKLLLGEICEIIFEKYDLTNTFDPRRHETRRGINATLGWGRSVGIILKDKKGYYTRTKKAWPHWGKGRLIKKK